MRIHVNPRASRQSLRCMQIAMTFSAWRSGEKSKAMSNHNKLCFQLRGFNRPPRAIVNPSILLVCAFSIREKTGADQLEPANYTRLNPTGALQHRPALAFLVMSLKSSCARRRLTARVLRSHLDTGNQGGLVWNGPSRITPRGLNCYHLLRGVGRGLCSYSRQV
jgi:hypothetical protein